MGTAVLCLWAVAATQGCTETFAPDCAGTSHFVFTDDLIKGKEQVLFAWQSYFGGFAEITLSNVLPRVISR